MLNFQKWPLIGNENIVNFLSRSIENNKVAGSYIFVGNKNLGKTSLAKFFAQTLFCQSTVKDKNTGLILPCGRCSVCNKMQGNKKINDFYHNDCYIVKQEKDKNVITVEQIRDLIVQLSRSSFSNSYKIGIIKNAENMHISASNAFLKTMEEPKNKVVIILISSSLANIPTTIISRSQVVNFRPVKISTIYDFLIKEYNIDRERAVNIAHISMGSPALAVKFLEEPEYYNLHTEISRVFVSFFLNDINKKFSDIDFLLKNNMFEQNLIKKTLNIIDIWKSVLRDLFLLNINQNNLIQNRNLSKQLESIRINKNIILNLFSILDNAKVQVIANVNPKFVLNDIASKI